MPLNSREKGKRGEREAAALLREAGFPKARRAQQYCGAAGTADVLVDAPFHVEVKNTARASLPEWIKQAYSDSGGKPWIILWKRSRDGWYVIAPADYILCSLAKVMKDVG